MENSNARAGKAGIPPRPGGNATQRMVEARRRVSAQPDSSLTGIISITIRVRRAFRNVMKPWFQCVLTP